MPFAQWNGCHADLTNSPHTVANEKAAAADDYKQRKDAKRQVQVGIVQEHYQHCNQPDTLKKPRYR